MAINFSGGNDEKATPVPIPNTVVKLLSADDTWLVTARESRSLPDLYQSPVYKTQGFVLSTGMVLLTIIYNEYTAFV